MCIRDSKNKDLALYEIGKVFEQTGNPKEDLPNEINSFAFALTGLVAEKDFQTPAVPVDFFYACLLYTSCQVQR